VNVSPKIPNPKSVPPERKKEKRNKERINSNFSSLQTGYHRKDLVVHPRPLPRIDLLIPRRLHVVWGRPG
jgi:hypothetical protein